MTLEGIKKVHFTGIGGIGMSALAQLMLHENVAVSGSDREASPTTDLLARQGVAVSFVQASENVPEGIDALVYSDAVPEDNPERAEAARRGVLQLSYFEMLGKVSGGKRTVAVAGTHGKTTTTGMLASILISAGIDPTVIVGSLMKDFGSNYRAGKSDWFVVEACEYQDHLLKLSPEVLVITNLEWDHTDYFPSLEALQETFKKAIAKVPDTGVIVTDKKNPNIERLLNYTKAKIIDYEDELTWFNEAPFTLRPGVVSAPFNQANARAAARAAQAVVPTLEIKDIRVPLSSFHGTWRRFEYKGQTAHGADVYDDYAHHPTAIRETVAALRAKTSGKVYVAFHPHLYSRTRDLFDDFAAAFGGADKVFIAPIYAAREEDDGSVSSEKLAAAIRARGVDATALDFDAIETALDEVGSGDVVMTMGAGDIYKVADKLVSR